MDEISISDFLNRDNKNYAKYVLERRAIPSIVDGMKTTQRKVFNAAKNIWKSGKNEEPKKVFQLAGYCADTQKFMHSNQSLEDTITVLGQSFKNNIPFFDEEGQWGSLRVPHAGAARYIGSSLNTLFYDVFKDFDLVERQFDGDSEIEPVTFSPIVPMSIINGSQGIAVGFASNILGRDPKRIIDVFIKKLKSENYNKVFKPLIKNFSGKIEQDKDNPLKWYFYGTFERINSTTIKITEFHPNKTFEGIETSFRKLLDDKLITSYENNSKENIDVLVKFRKSELDSYSEEQLRKLLDLDCSITENLTLLDENGDIKVYSSISDIIDSFFENRLKEYSKRKGKLINDINKDILILNNKVKFLKYIISKKISVNNIPKKDIISKLTSFKFDLINDSFDYLLNMSIYSLTKETYLNLTELLKKKKVNLKEIKKLSEKDMYIKELEELRKVVGNIK